MDIPCSAGALVLSKGNPVWVRQELSAQEPKHSRGGHWDLTSLRQPEGPEAPWTSLGTNTGSVGDQPVTVSLGKGSRGITALSSAGNSRKILSDPKVEEPHCVHPTNPHSQNCRHIPRPGLRLEGKERRSRKSTWNHSSLQE